MFGGLQRFSCNFFIILSEFVVKFFIMSSKIGNDVADLKMLFNPPVETLKIWQTRTFFPLKAFWDFMRQKFITETAYYLTK